jgi:hypothetical protein
MHSSDKHQDPTPNSDMPEILQAATPIALVAGATIIGVAALLSAATDSVKIDFAGAASAGLAAAGSLASPHKSKAQDTGIKQIGQADSVDVNL